MASSPTPPERSRTPNGNSDYKFYDENYRPIWNRGISRKIGESTFVQQKLPTIRPSWSPLKVCPFLLLMGAFFVGMGVGIKKFADHIYEEIIPYTDCESIDHPGRRCVDIINPDLNKAGRFYEDANDRENCTCHISFTLNEPLNGTIYIYYALTDFYQNHRDYYLSRDENQLKGNLFDKKDAPKKPSSACKPFDIGDDEKIIYPCGLMANSMFTDVIDLVYHPDEDDIVNKWSVDERRGESQRREGDLSVPLKNTGIAWESDRMDKYENPDKFYNESDPIWDNFTKPYNWKKSLWQLDPANASNNGVLNEDFIVWMRTAAFPWFRKLYRIVDSSFYPFENGLPRGRYTFRIQYNYDVRWEKTEGEKKLIVTTSNIVGGKNIFLSIVYMGTGSLCIFISIVLFIVHKFARHYIEKSIKED